MILKPLDTKEEFEWMQAKTWIELCESTRGIVAIDDKGIAGCVVMDKWTDSSCQAHIAIRNPLCIRHGLITAACEYVFITNNRKTMFGLVPDTNKKAERFDKHIGFEEVTRIPDAFNNGVGYIVMRMDRDKCRWLPAMKEAA